MEVVYEFRTGHIIEGPGVPRSRTDLRRGTWKTLDDGYYNRQQSVM